MGDTVKRVNFEQAADFLLLAAPMHKNDTPDNEHRISAVYDEGSDDNNKANNYKGFKRVYKGSSGLELRYHAFKEYKKMPEDQREELRLWRSKRSNKNTHQGDTGGKPKKQKNDSRISALETQKKYLNDKITQLLAKVSAQGQSAQEPQNTTA